MPGRTCCVPGCRSNHDNYSPYVSTFCVPAEEERQNEWLRLIRREDLIGRVAKHTVVCIKHFVPQHVITADYINTRTGLVEIPRQIPKLTDDAFPSKFPDYSIPVPPSRKDPETRIKEIELVERRKALAQKRKEVEADKIKSFEDLKSSVVHKFTHFLSIPTETHVLFHRIEDDDFNALPKIKIAFKISVDFSVKVYQNSEILSSIKLEQFLGSDLKCNMWSKLQSLSNFLETFDLSTTITLAERVKKFSQNIKEVLSDDIQVDDEVATKLEFLIEQLELTFMSCIRYSPKMLVWAATLFYSYPGAYRSMRGTNCLTLPYPGYLQRFLVKMGNNGPGLGPGQIAFLKEKFKLLEENKKIVALMIDEICVTSRIVYKGGKIYGLAEETSDESDITAQTLQAFMYNSLDAPNKDVIALFPVRKLNAEILLKLSLDVLKVMGEVGFRVLCMISDDNQVNAKTYKLLGNGKLEISIPHPFNPDEKLFFLFDQVHLFKNGRNNWSNASEKLLKIPAVDDSHALIDQENLLMSSVLGNEFDIVELETMDARFSDVIHLFNADKNAIVKLAPKLSRKTVYPSSVERQNVQLVVNLYHDTTIVALETLKKDGIDISEGTIKLLKLFSRWWKVCNVKNYFKGKRINDVWSEPIRNDGITEDWKLTYLREFKKFLEAWNLLPGGGKLTPQTHTAFVHTIEATLSLCDHVFQKYGWKSILLGKLQTDNLEGRFGAYRRMSGSNYHISVEQVCESEKKLKLLGVLKMTSAKGGEFSIKSFGEDCEKTVRNLKVEENLDFFKLAIYEKASLSVSVNQYRVLICLASYSAKKVIQHFGKTKNEICFRCINGFVTDEPLEIERAEEIYDYLSAIDRGGLNKPSDFSFDLCVNIFKLFSTLISKKYEDQFLKLQNPHQAIVTLGLQMFENVIEDAVSACDACGLEGVKVLKKFLRTMANCLMKNYSKNLQESNTARQLAIQFAKKAAKEEKKKEKMKGEEKESNAETVLKSSVNAVAAGKIKDPIQRKLVKPNPDRLGVSDSTRRTAVEQKVIFESKTVKLIPNQRQVLKDLSSGGTSSLLKNCAPQKNLYPISHQPKILKASSSNLAVAKNSQKYSSERQIIRLIPNHQKDSCQRQIIRMVPNPQQTVKILLNKENVHPQAEVKQRTIVKVIPVQQNILQSSTVNEQKNLAQLVKPNANKQGSRSTTKRTAEELRCTQPAKISKLVHDPLKRQALKSITNTLP